MCRHGYYLDRIFKLLSHCLRVERRVWSPATTFWPSGWLEVLRDVNIWPYYIMIDSSSSLARPDQWSQVRVVRVIPVTDILKPEIKDQLIRLYSMLHLSRPLLLEGTTEGASSFDGTPHALKTISKIVIRSEDVVHAICVAYLDGTWSVRHGGSGGTEQVFVLSNGRQVLHDQSWADLNRRFGCLIRWTRHRGLRLVRRGVGSRTPVHYQLW